MTTHLRLDVEQSSRKINYFNLKGFFMFSQTRQFGNPCYFGIECFLMIFSHMHLIIRAMYMRLAHGRPQDSFSGVRASGIAKVSGALMTV